MRAVRLVLLVLTALVALGGLALVAWSALELRAMNDALPVNERGFFGWAGYAALGALAALVAGGAWALAWLGGRTAGPAAADAARGGTDGIDFSAASLAGPGRIDLDALTVKEVPLADALAAFARLREDLARNLEAVDAFRARIDGEYARREADWAAASAETEALAESAQEADAAVGKFEVFKQLVKAFTGAPGPAEVLSYVIELSARVTGSARASIMLVDRNRENLYLHKTLGWTPDAETSARRVPLGEGFAGHVARENKRMLVTDVEAETGQGNKPGYQSKSFVILPLAAGPDVVGVLNLTDKPGGALYDFDDLELLNLLLAQASLALENASLRGKLVG